MRTRRCRDCAGTGKTTTFHQDNRVYAPTPESTAFKPLSLIEIRCMHCSGTGEVVVMGKWWWQNIHPDDVGSTLLETFIVGFASGVALIMIILKFI